MTSRRRTGKPSQITRAKCDNYVYGDEFNDAVWELAGLSNPALVVSLTPERKKAELIVDLNTETPRIVRMDDIDQAGRYLDRVVAGVIDPDAHAAKRVTEDLGALLAGEINHEEFVNRGREVYDVV